MAGSRGKASTTCGSTHRHPPGIWRAGSRGRGSRPWPPSQAAERALQQAQDRAVPEPAEGTPPTERRRSQAPVSQDPSGSTVWSATSAAPQGRSRLCASRGSAPPLWHRHWTLAGLSAALAQVLPCDQILLDL